MENEQKNSRKALFLAMAILVALIIWFYVDEFGNNGNPRLRRKTFEEIPIEYIHEEDLMDHGLMLVDEGSDHTVTIELEANRRTIAQIDREKLRVTADLSEITTDGTQSVQPRLTYSGYRWGGERITITQSMVKEIDPFVATVNIGELNSKPVEVRCELRGNVAEGYSAGQLKLSDSSIEIWGQAEDIDPVSYAKVTLDIGEDAEESVEKSLTVTFYDADNRPLDGEGIRSTVQKIKVNMPVFVTKELRLTAKLKDAPGAREKNVKISFEPKSITVSGDASQLNNRETIVLTEFNLMDLLANGGSGVYEYPITVPQGCANLSGVTRATMTISFADMDSAKVTTDRFVYHNLPEGKEVEVLSNELTVTLFGAAEDVKNVTPEHVTVVVDLSDYTEASGTYTVPAHVDVTGADIGIKGQYEVRVNIREKQQEEITPPEENTPESEDPDETKNTGD